MEEKRAQLIVPVIDSYISAKPLPAPSGTFASSTSPPRLNREISPIPNLEEWESARQYLLERTRAARNRNDPALTEPAPGLGQQSRSRSPQVSVMSRPVRTRSPVVSSSSGATWNSALRASSGDYARMEWATTRHERSREAQFGEKKQLVSRGSYVSDVMDSYRHAWLAWRRISDNLLADPHLPSDRRAQLQQLADTQRTVMDGLWDQQEMTSRERSEESMGFNEYLEDDLAGVGDEGRHDDEHDYYDRVDDCDDDEVEDMDYDDEMDHEGEDQWY